MNLAGHRFDNWTSTRERNYDPGQLDVALSRSSQQSANFLPTKNALLKLALLAEAGCGIPQLVANSTRSSNRSKPSVRPFLLTERSLPLLANSVLRSCGIGPAAK